MWVGAGKLTPDQVRMLVLETCWRCNKSGVKNIELGLCKHCIETLRDPDFVRHVKITKIPDGPARPEEREETDSSTD